MANAGEKVTSVSSAHNPPPASGGGWSRAVATAAIAVILTAGTYHSLRDVINSYSLPPPKKLVTKEQFTVLSPRASLLGTFQRDSELRLMLEQDGLPDSRIILAVGPHNSGKTSLICSCLSANGSPTLVVEPRESAALYRVNDLEEEEASPSYLLKLLSSALTVREESQRRGSPTTEAAVKEENIIVDAMADAQQLYESLAEALHATEAAGRQPTIFIDNFDDLVSISESEEDRQVLESLLCWLMAIAKNKGSARVILASSNPFVLDDLSKSVTERAVAEEFREAVTQLTVGEGYTSNAAASMLADLCKKFDMTLSAEVSEELIQNLGASCAAMSQALRAIQEGCTVEQAIDWALADSMEAARALLHLGEGLLLWELFNVLAGTSGNAKNNLAAPRYISVNEVLESFKDKRQHPQILALLQDSRVQQLLYYYRRPTLEMVRTGAPAHLPHIGMTTTTLRAFERLTRDDAVKREMWERRRK